MFKSIIDDASTTHESSKLYRGVVLKATQIGENSVVGDFSRLFHSRLNDFTRIDRSNFILASTIDSYSYTGANDVIMHTEIGKFCSISWGVTVGPGEHDYSLLSSHDFLYNKFYGICENGESYDRYSKLCEIGNDVWIGTNSTILRGVKIGDGAVVGANSLVNRDVPPYAIVVGCPARIIKYRFSQTEITELLDLRWWNLSHDIIKHNLKLFKDPDITKVINTLKKL